ncbi:MAG: hypothetical protein ACAF41_04855 [Leptolyngbya sp. BL-A-14]
MLRRHHHLPEAYLWVLLWFLLALLLLMAEAALLTQPAIASVGASLSEVST